MPIEHCQVKSKPGYRFGSKGHCYSYTGSERSRKLALARAKKQGRAIEWRKTMKAGTLARILASRRGSMDIRRNAIDRILGGAQKAHRAPGREGWPFRYQSDAVLEAMHRLGANPADDKEWDMVFDIANRIVSDTDQEADSAVQSAIAQYAEGTKETAFVFLKRAQEGAEAEIGKEMSWLQRNRLCDALLKDLDPITGLARGLDGYRYGAHWVHGPMPYEPWRDKWREMYD